MSLLAFLAPLSVRRVDERGVRLIGWGDRPIDVEFDGRRVWSFWLERDTRHVGWGVRAVDWPRTLRRFLDGSTRLRIREHVSGRVLFDSERRFGDAEGRIAVVNANGVPLGIDKSGRMTPTFESRSPEQVEPLLDAIDTVLTALHDAGVEAFPGYGTLLGAVRERRFLGHDSDADLCYVSRCRRPVDVARESFALQRALEDRGFRTRRYSGGAFKVDVLESDGVVRGLDVFAGYLDDDPLADGSALYLMGEVGTPFREEWIFPLGSCTLEGREFPAPAQPGHLLAAMYGPGWKVPDPAFKFTTPERVVRQLDGWFRGTRPNRSLWDRRYSTVRQKLPAKLDGSALARRLVAEDGLPGQLVDLGCGRGGDLLWFARQGVRVTGYDFAPAGALAVRRQAEAEGLALDFRELNLNELRSVLGEGARIARAQGPRAVLARHTLDALTPFGREALVRFASMALREGGRLYLDVWTGDGTPPTPHLTPLAVDRAVALLERQDFRIVARQEIPAARDGGWPRHSVGRVVATLAGS